MTNFYLDKIIIRWYGSLSFAGEAILKPGVNLILGRNGSGKTLTLRMIENASRGQQAHSLKSSQKEIDTITEEQLVYLSLQDGTTPQSVTFLKNGSWQNYDSLKSRIRFISSDRSVRGQLSTSNPFKQFSDFLVPEPNNEINIVDEFNKALISELLRKVKDLKQEIPDLTKEIEDYYQSGLVDFEKSIKIDFDRDSPAFLIDYRGREVQLPDLSAGEKEYLYFLAFLYRVRDEKSKIILIDEPELHLHGSQIRKLCELINAFSQNNQVVIATHSGDILHHFLREANIVLLNKGEMKNVEVTQEIKEVAEQLGLLVDPSFFTSHWICAENNPNSPLQGQDAPKTSEVLEWIFGKSREKRFWAFGAQKGRAEALVDVLQEVNLSQTQIRLSILFDGDRLVDSQDNYPPTIMLSHFPFWELENTFLHPDILNKLIPSAELENGNEIFWKKVAENKKILVQSILGTIIKNAAFVKRRYEYFQVGTLQELEAWKTEVAGVSIDEMKIRATFDAIITLKNWKWLPGKEALSLALELNQTFWNDIRKMVRAGDFLSIISSDTDIKSLIESVNQNA